MVKAKSTQKTSGKKVAIDLRQDLNDFKNTKKSIQDLIKVKQDNKLKGEADAEQMSTLKKMEEQAISSLDKLFKGKRK